jgi:lysylphosphatidylglycerol synthetase-like protein (DUF2156 family)
LTGVTADKRFERTRRLASTVSELGKLAPAVMFGIVALGAMSYLFTFPRPIATAVAAVLPIDLNDADPTFGILSAVGLGALSVGLLRGKQVAWWLALATVAATLFGQSDALQHPVRTAVVGGVLAVLVADRRRYRVETDAGWRRIIVALLVVVGVAVGLETSLIVASTGRWPAPLAMLSDATAAIGGAFGIDDDTAAGLLRGTSFNVLLGLLLLAARLPMVLAAIGVLARVPEAPPDPSTRARARQIGARYGRGALLPFQLGDDKLLYCPSDADGCIVYGLAGRTAVVVGDPIAADDSCLAVLDAFRDQSYRFDRKVTFYQASDAMRASLVRAGFYVFKVGQEALIDLAGFDLAGSRRANLRHTITRCGRGGVSVKWLPNGLGSGRDATGLLDELGAIDLEWRRGAGPRMGFTISDLDEEALRTLPVSIAFDQAGKVVAYSTFRPTGPDRGWVLDLMRRVPHGEPGAVEWCIAEAALGLKAMNADRLSLGLAPLAGLSATSGPAAERLLAMAARWARRRYDVLGLAFFKAKFDPVWVPRYGAIGRGRDLAGYGVALLRLHYRKTNLRAATVPYSDVRVSVESVR